LVRWLTFQAALWLSFRAASTDLERFEPEGSVASPRANLGRLDEHSFSGALEGRDSVARRHVVAAWANAASYGQAAKDTARAIDRLYPTLVHSRGVREATIGIIEARMIGAVRERGERPLAPRELLSWTQPRERSGSWMDRSR
jgi:hypothetical protein